MTDQQLWQACKAGDAKARETLIEKNRGLVIHMARRKNHGPDKEQEDLISEGFIGLIKAVDRFDPSRGIAFGSYAGKYIMGAMQDYLRSTSWMTINRLREARAGKKTAYEYVSWEDERDSEPVFRRPWEAASDWQEPAREAIGGQFLLWVKEQLCGVSEVDGQALWLQYVEEWEPREVARHLGLPARTMWNRRLALRKQFQERLKEESVL